MTTITRPIFTQWHTQGKIRYSPFSIKRGIGNLGSRIIEDIRCKEEPGYSSWNRSGRFQRELVFLILPLSGGFISIAIIHLLFKRFGNEVDDVRGSISVLKAPNHHIADLGAWRFKVINPDGEAIALGLSETGSCSAIVTGSSSKCLIMEFRSLNQTKETIVTLIKSLNLKVAKTWQNFEGSFAQVIWIQ